MDSRLANGLQQTHVPMKSAHGAQAKAPQLTSPRLAFSPRHEKNERGEAILAPSRFTLQRVRGAMTNEASGGKWSDERGRTSLCFLREFDHLFMNMSATLKLNPTTSDVQIGSNSRLESHRVSR